MVAVQGFWVPILCDACDFKHIVFDSVDKAVYSSGWIAGLDGLLRPLHKSKCQIRLIRSNFSVTYHNQPTVTEYLFDWFIMGYINAIRAVWCLSSSKSKHKKRESIEMCSNALHSAGKPHLVTTTSTITWNLGKATWHQLEHWMHLRSVVLLVDSGRKSPSKEHFLNYFRNEQGWSLPVILIKASRPLNWLHHLSQSAP